MPEVAVTILGLNRVGTSIGLALKQYNQRANAKHQFKVTGYSGRGEQIKMAQKLGAIDQVVGQPFEAVRGRDIVIMTMPYAEVESVYQSIGSELRPGVVVLDFSPLKVNPLKWAAKHLSKDAHVVCMTPLFNPLYLFDSLDTPENARADLFENGTMLLMPSVTCIEQAIELAEDFASILGSRRQFIDSAEHDSMMAATDIMPTLLGLAYYTALSNATGWGDVQRTTNPAFGTLTRTMFDTHPDDLVASLRDSRQDLTRVIDTVMLSLKDLRAALVSDDRDALEAAATSAAETYETWYNNRYHWKFDKTDQKSPDTPGMMSMFLGSSLANRLRGKKDGDDK